MGVQVTFDYASWIQAFPQFGSLNELQVTGPALTLAEQFCRNDGGGPVTKAATQTNLLNLMVAHVCQLMYGVNGEAASPLVGRINSATEGSVSVQAEWPQGSPAAAWYLQTPFGAMYWQATLPYRTMRYIPGPQRSFSPWRNQ